jgi:hypothetical protein
MRRGSAAAAAVAVNRNDPLPALSGVMWLESFSSQRDEQGEKGEKGRTERAMLSPHPSVPSFGPSTELKDLPPEERGGGGDGEPGEDVDAVLVSDLDLGRPADGDASSRKGFSRVVAIYHQKEQPVSNAPMNQPRGYGGRKCKGKEGKGKARAKGRRHTID